jgi:hypothetical protein
VRNAVTFERRIFAVIDDWRNQHARVFQCTTHQQRRCNRSAIVGKRDAACGLLFAKLGELLSRRSQRHCADRVYACEPGLGGFLQDELCDARMIIDRFSIRHTCHGREATSNCRCGTTRDRLFVFLPGFSQVHVNIDEAGNDEAALRNFNDVGAVRRKVAPDLGNALAFDENIEGAVPPG